MDEPFAALDAITRDVLQGELLRVWQATGTAILFVTHDVREAVRLGAAGRAAVVAAGHRGRRVGRVGDGPMELHRPARDHRAARGGHHQPSA